jgi:hypothetical protein
LLLAAAAQAQVVAVLEGCGLEQSIYFKEQHIQLQLEQEEPETQVELRQFLDLILQFLPQQSLQLLVLVEENLE